MISTEHKDKFFETYTEYTRELVNLHNRYHRFVIHCGAETALDFRRAIRKLVRLERELQKLSFVVYKEHQRNRKEMKTLLKGQQQKTGLKKRSKLSRPKHRGFVTNRKPGRPRRVRVDLNNAESLIDLIKNLEKNIAEKKL